MKTLRALIIALAAVTLSMTASCRQVTITGRKQLDLIPAAMIQSLSFENYKEFLAKNKLSTNTQQTQMVQRVGRRVQSAVEKYCTETGQSGLLKGYQWEFNLVEDAAQNAWVMPGGKVVVYTGLLPITKDDTGLAVVMGHEIAHALANHGGERMTHGLLIELGGVALDKALEQKPEQTQQLFRQAYGVGSEVGVALPYSRLQESEADHIGLIFMAIAGYDPNAALDFWQRMASESKGSAGPEFLSTHPAHQTRIDNIKELIPEAMQYYRKPLIQ